MVDNEKEKDIELYSPIQIPHGMRVFQKRRSELLLIPIALILLLSMMLTGVLHVKEIPTTAMEIIKAFQYDNVGVVIGIIVILRYLMQICLVVFSVFSFMDASYSYCQMNYSNTEDQKIMYQNNMILALFSGFILIQPATQNLTKLAVDYSDNFTVLSLVCIGIAIASVLLFRCFFIRIVGRCEFEQKLSKSLNKLLNLSDAAFERLYTELETSYPEENLGETLNEFQNIRDFMKDPEGFLKDVDPEEGIQIGSIRKIRKMPDVDKLLKILEIESEKENNGGNKNE